MTAGEGGSAREATPATARGAGATPFEAADLAARRVSYVDLLAAGVDPGRADELRRAHSLVWSHEWRIGGDLRHRAARIRGLRREERAWIAASYRPEDDGEPAAPGLPLACPRCGGDLEAYALGGHEARMCGSCGRVGVAVRREQASTADESWDEAIRRFEARTDGTGTGTRR